MKKAPSRRPARQTAKPKPTLVDIRNLVGQMKGILTWMSKERVALQDIIQHGNELLARLGTLEPLLAPEASSSAATEGGAAEAPVSGAAVEQEHHKDGPDQYNDQTNFL